MEIPPRHPQGDAQGRREPVPPEEERPPPGETPPPTSQEASPLAGGPGPAACHFCKHALATDALFCGMCGKPRAEAARARGGRSPETSADAPPSAKPRQRPEPAGESPEGHSGHLAFGDDTEPRADAASGAPPALARKAGLASFLAVTALALVGGDVRGSSASTSASVVTLGDAVQEANSSVTCRAEGEVPAGGACVGSDARSSKSVARAVKGWPSCAQEGSCLFTIESLQRFDGRSGGETKILLSVVSYVFDVSAAPHYYGPSASYASMAGKEVARCLATMSMEDEDLESHSLVDLTEEQWEELFQWIDKYQEKYPLVGRLLDWRPGVDYEDINQRSGFSLRPPTVA